MTKYRKRLLLWNQVGINLVFSTFAIRNAAEARVHYCCCVSSSFTGFGILLLTYFCVLLLLLI